MPSENRTVQWGALCSVLNIIRVIRSQGVRWMGLIMYAWETCTEFSWEGLKGKAHLEDPGIDGRTVGNRIWGCDLIHVIQRRDQWKDFVKIIKLKVPWRMNNFLSSWALTGSLKRHLLHGVHQPMEFRVHFIAVTGKLPFDFKIPCRMALSCELACLLICPQIQVWWMRRHGGILLKTIQCCRSHSVVMAQVRRKNYHFLWLVTSSFSDLGIRISVRNLSNYLMALYWYHPSAF